MRRHPKRHRSIRGSASPLASAALGSVSRAAGSSVFAAVVASGRSTACGRVKTWRRARESVRCGTRSACRRSGSQLGVACSTVSTRRGGLTASHANRTQIPTSKSQTTKQIVCRSSSYRVGWSGCHGIAGRLGARLASAATPPRPSRAKAARVQSGIVGRRVISMRALTAASALRSPSR
jgi:hypothetical protein